MQEIAALCGRLSIESLQPRPQLSLGLRCLRQKFWFKGFTGLGQPRRALGFDSRVEPGFRVFLTL